MVTFSAGIVAVEKACLHLSEHLIFVSGEKDEACVKEVFKGLAMV